MKNPHVVIANVDKLKCFCTCTINFSSKLIDNCEVHGQAYIVPTIWVGKYNSGLVGIHGNNLYLDPFVELKHKIARCLTRMSNVVTLRTFDFIKNVLTWLFI